MPRRPTSITVMAILAIVFGSFGVLCHPINIVMQFIQIPGAPAAAAMRHDPIIFLYTIVAHVIGLVMCILLLLGGIGSLLLKPAARKAMLVYAIMQSAITLASLAFILLVYLPRASGLIVIPRSPIPVGAAIAISAAITTAATLVWTGLIYFFFMQPNAKAAFEGREWAAQTPFPGAY